MFDPKSLLNDLLGSTIPGTGSTVRDTAGKATQMAKDNPLAAGALVAVLLGTGTGRQVTGTALKLGGIAAIGGLAYKAYQNYKNGDKPADACGPAGYRTLLPPPEDTSFHPSQAPQGEAEFALTLVRAMIAAANADGHIDEAEQKKIADKLALSGISAEAEQFLRAEIAKPLSIDELVKAVQTDAQKLELYTASRLTIDPDTRTERGYLDLLAGRLGLPDALIDHVEATVSAVKTARTVGAVGAGRQLALVNTAEAGRCEAAGLDCPSTPARSSRSGRSSLPRNRAPASAEKADPVGDEQIGDAVDERPCGGDHELAGIARHGVGFRVNAATSSTRTMNAALDCVCQALVRSARPVGSEHQPEQRRVGEREFDVADARCDQLRARRLFSARMTALHAVAEAFARRQQPMPSAARWRP